MYKLYNRPLDRLKDSLGLSRKKLYKEHYALKDVSFDIGEGECVGIIGTNGSGKSTILKIITGVLAPTAGTVTVNGRISALLELGAGFNGEYSGLENVYLNGSMIGFSREEIDAKLQSILDFADIGEFIHQPVKTYSSGMFVRLAFAVAINIDPEILIVDEALSVGDVFFQAKCYRKFEEFKEMGKTILFVSHDLSSIGKYCDRVVLLNKGEKLAEGGAKEMVNLYRRVLVNQYDDADLEEGAENAEAGQDGQLTDGTAGENVSKKEHAGGGRAMKDSLNLNPKVLEYGSKLGEIVDFAIRDDTGMITNVIEKGKEFSVQMKVRFQADVNDPIFAFTLKDLKGTEITGTNTMFERVDVELAKAGEVYEVTFAQKAMMQGGEYMMSFSCTGFENGEFVVHQRLYDITKVAIVSEQDTVGFFDLDSKVTVEKLQ